MSAYASHESSKASCPVAPPWQLLPLPLQRPPPHRQTSTPAHRRRVPWWWCLRVLTSMALLQSAPSIARCSRELDLTWLDLTSKIARHDSPQTHRYSLRPTLRHRHTRATPSSCALSAACIPLTQPWTYLPTYLLTRAAGTARWRSPRSSAASSQRTSARAPTLCSTRT